MPKDAHQGRPSTAQVEARLEELESDDRLTKYKPAIVEINAPLALHQTAAEAEAHALRWVLGLPRRRYPDGA